MWMSKIVEKRLQKHCKNKQLTPTRINLNFLAIRAKRDPHQIVKPCYTG